MNQIFDFLPKRIHFKSNFNDAVIWKFSKKALKTFSNTLKRKKAGGIS